MGNVGGISELVHNDVNGYTLKNDAAVFAEKIDYILENPQVYDKMSQSSKELYNEHFTVDKMVDGYMEKYNRLLGEMYF